MSVRHPQGPACRARCCGARCRRLCACVRGQQVGGCRGARMRRGPRARTRAGSGGPTCAEPAPIVSETPWGPALSRATRLARSVGVGVRALRGGGACCTRVTRLPTGRIKGGNARVCGRRSARQCIGRGGGGPRPCAAPAATAAAVLRLLARGAVRLKKNRVGWASPTESLVALKPSLGEWGPACERASCKSAKLGGRGACVPPLPRAACCSRLRSRSRTTVRFLGPGPSGSGRATGGRCREAKRPGDQRQGVQASAIGTEWAAAGGGGCLQAAARAAARASARAQARDSADPRLAIVRIRVRHGQWCWFYF